MMRPTGLPETSQSLASATRTAMSSPQTTELVDSPASQCLSTTGATGPTVAAMKAALVEVMVALCSDR